MKDKKASADSILRAANTLICHTSFFGGLDLEPPVLCPGGRKCSLSWGEGGASEDRDRWDMNIYAADIGEIVRDGTPQGWAGVKMAGITM